MMYSQQPHFISPPRSSRRHLDIPSQGTTPIQTPISQYYNGYQQGGDIMISNNVFSTNGGGPNSMINSKYDIATQQAMASQIPALQLNEGERLLEDAPDGMPTMDEDGNYIRYLEVPVIEEVIRHVPRVQHVYREKLVPRIEEIWVDKIVEVPQVEIKDTFIDMPVVEEFFTQVPRHQIVDVEKEVIRHVPKIEYKTVEKVVEIPGKIIEIPRPYTVEKPIYIPRICDKQVPVLVAQIVQPLITGLSEQVKEIPIPNYQPKFHVIDVPVARPIKSCLINNGVLSEECRIVQVPPGQYNSILRHLNMHLVEAPEKQQYLPYVPDESSGQVSFCEEFAPSGPVAFPMPILNSPQPAFPGASIAAPSVHSEASPDLPYPHGYRPNYPPSAQSASFPPADRRLRGFTDMDTMNYPRDMTTTPDIYDVPSPRATRHHGKPRSQRSARHARRSSEKDGRGSHRSGGSRRF